MTDVFVTETPIGKLKITEQNGFITGISETIDIADNSFSHTDNNLIREVVKQINDYFAGSRNELTFPAKLSGTEFQMSVWKMCCKIPYGSKASYKEIAAGIGNPWASRAVGNALSANPILLYVPCHRVVSSSGLGGFRLGLESKKLLLSLESHSVYSTDRRELSL